APGARGRVSGECGSARRGGCCEVRRRGARGGGGEPPQPTPPLELVMVEVESPKPAPEEMKEAAPRPMPKPPIKVASVKRFKRKENVPPPPNEPPPAEEPPRQAPLVVGMTMSSTTTGGAYAAPVGNTLYGKAEPQAQAPQDVKPYSAPRYVPIYQVDSPPAVLLETKIPYPEGARREGIEGTVLLSIVVDV